MESEKVFRDLLEEIAKEQNYKEYSLEVSPIFTGGANYSSLLFGGTISAPNKESLKVFGKVAAMNPSLRDEMASSALFDIERIVYEELVKIYEKIEKKHGIPEEDRLVFCKFYGSSSGVNQETIILEDLTANGYTLHDRMKSVDWPYASKAVEVLAKFHALSMCYEEEYPDSFERHGKHFATILKNIPDFFNKAFKMTFPHSLAVVKEENKERFKAFFTDEDKIDFCQFFKPVRKPVLIHGDYRPSNLMHRNNADGSVDVIPVDFQSIQPSSGIIDLLYFIFMGTDGAFRKKYYKKLIELYYTTISRMLRAYGLNPDKVYSREDFEYELKEKLPYGLVVSAFALSMVTVESVDAPSLAEERAGLDSFVVKPGKLFAGRLNDVVDDYVEWGLL
ncbi:uncharacterized protein LOC106136448 [Amyelois transitella]|uniref:uncharacterized protein LOC106136448 n=1 Tax=Amyelois transitella TaxID=680683 RepID=UPI00298F8099|nr:uncharacterized protein LOC106136448 [Amyelois transitella]